MFMFYKEFYILDIYVCSPHLYNCVRLYEEKKNYGGVYKNTNFNTLFNLDPLHKR